MPSRSSDVRLPVTSSSAARASCRSVRTNSSATGPPAPRPPRRARAAPSRARSSSAAWRTLVTAAVSRAVRIRRFERRAIAARSPSRPAPVFDDTRDAGRLIVASRPGERQIGLVRNDESRHIGRLVAADRRSASSSGQRRDRVPPAPGPRSPTPAARASTPSISTSSLGRAHAGCVDELDPQAVDIDRLGHRDRASSRALAVTIARPVADQRVEQARLADVRLAGDRDARALANQPAALRLAQQRGDRPLDRTERRAVSPARRSDIPRPENRATPRAAREIEQSASIAAIRPVSVPSS